MNYGEAQKTTKSDHATLLPVSQPLLDSRGSVPYPNVAWSDLGAKSKKTLEREAQKKDQSLSFTVPHNERIVYGDNGSKRTGL